MIACDWQASVASKEGINNAAFASLAGYDIVGCNSCRHRDGGCDQVQVARATRRSADFSGSEGQHVVKTKTSRPQVVKSYLSLTEAAEVAGCSTVDLLHLAVQGRLALLVSLPDDVEVKIFAESNGKLYAPFLRTPHLLVLNQSHCVKLELNGHTSQSDFSSGYLMEQGGSLKEISPQYGPRPELDHVWVYWRSTKEGRRHPLSLSLEVLLVTWDGLQNLLNVKNSSDNQRNNSHLKLKVKTVGISNVETEAGETSAVDTLKIDEVQSRSITSAKSKIVTVKRETKDVASSDGKSETEHKTIIRLKEVQNRTGLSRSTIYDRMNEKSARYDSSFPKQFSLGGDSVGWLESDITQWVNSRANVLRN